MMAVAASVIWMERKIKKTYFSIYIYRLARSCLSNSKSIFTPQSYEKKIWNMHVYIRCQPMYKNYSDNNENLLSLHIHIIVYHINVRWIIVQWLAVSRHYIQKFLWILLILLLLLPSFDTGITCSNLIYLTYLCYIYSYVRIFLAFLTCIVGLKAQSWTIGWFIKLVVELVQNWTRNTKMQLAKRIQSPNFY